MQNKITPPSPKTWATRPVDSPHRVITTHHKHNTAGDPVEAVGGSAVEKFRTLNRMPSIPKWGKSVYYLPARDAVLRHQGQKTCHDGMALPLFLGSRWARRKSAETPRR